MGNSSFGVIDNWIRHIKDIYRFNKEKLEPIEKEEERFNKFVELNVKEQVLNLAKTSIVQTAWKNGQELYLHGWVYGLNSGYVTDLEVNFSKKRRFTRIVSARYLRIIYYLKIKAIVPNVVHSPFHKFTFH